MLNLHQASVVVVAAEMAATADLLESTYVSHLRTSAEAIEGLRQSGLPISQKHRFSGQLLAGQIAAREWQKQLVAAISSLQVFHKSSNQAETDVGCAAPWGTEFFTTGQAAPSETEENLVPEVN